MSRDAGAGSPGWTIGQSAALELDVALTAIRGYFMAGGLPEDFTGMLQELPAVWRAELAELLGDSRSLVSLLEPAAYLAGVLMEADYSRATLVIRDLTVEAALERLAEPAGRWGVTAVPGKRPEERLIELSSRLVQAAYAEAGFEVAEQDRAMRRFRQNMGRVVQILRGGDWHARFWHGLDRFTYRFYQPWRDQRAILLAEQEKQAATVLGAVEKTGQPPELAWLPAQNPALRYPELQAAVEAGRLHVLFWVEPFGLADAWSLWPGQLVISFAEAGVLYDKFQAFADNVAARTRALADPTRLMMLRLIRHFGAINTEIAAYLGLARPTVSTHAKILREAGLIRSRVEGRAVRHELVTEELRRLFADLAYLLDLPEEQDEQ